MAMTPAATSTAVRVTLGRKRQTWAPSRSRAVVRSGSARSGHPDASRRGAGSKA